MVFAVVEARDLQIALLSILPGGYPAFSVCIVVALIKPDDFALAAVEPDPLWDHVVVVDVATESHHEERPFDGQGLHHRLRTRSVGKAGARGSR